MKKEFTKIITLCFNLFLYLIRVIYQLFISINLFVFKKTKLEADNQRYSNILYLGISIIILFSFFGVYFFKTVYIAVVPAILGFILLIYILLHILRNTKKSTASYYKFLTQWSVALMFYIIITFGLFWSNIVNYFLGILIFIIVYFGFRFIVVRLLKNWGVFILFFLVTPIFAFFSWGILSEAIISIKPSYSVLLSDKAYGWGVFIGIILLTNITIFFTEERNLKECKVAIYFLLALFSILSYCFFISDWIAEAIQPVIIHETVDEIKKEIDKVITWITLPFLIGSVLGCFCLELRERNIDKKKMKIRKKYRLVKN